MNFSAIPPNCVADLWPHISPGLEDLLENHTLGKWDADDVLANLQDNEWQLFIVSEDTEIVVCIVCSIMEGHKKTLELGLCWGKDADSWSDQVNQSMEQIGRELGCDQLALDGRPGWRNIMRKFGYELNSMRYVRPING